MRLRIGKTNISTKKPVAMARDLLNDQPKSKNQQSVELAGFCAWVVAPADEKLRRAAMVHKAHLIYGKACESVALAVDKSPGAKPPIWTPKSLKRFKSK